MTGLSYDRANMYIYVYFLKSQTWKIKATTKILILSYLERYVFFNYFYSKHLKTKNIKQYIENLEFFGYFDYLFSFLIMTT